MQLKEIEKTTRNKRPKVLQDLGELPSSQKKSNESLLLKKCEKETRKQVLKTRSESVLSKLGNSNHLSDYEDDSGTENSLKNFSTNRDLKVRLARLRYDDIPSNKSIFLEENKNVTCEKSASSSSESSVSESADKAVDETFNTSPPPANGTSPVASSPKVNELAKKASPPVINDESAQKPIEESNNASPPPANGTSPD